MSIFQRSCGVFFACVAVCVVIGCGPRTSPTPLPYRAGAPNDARFLLTAATEARNIDLDEQPSTIDVLYATDRQPKAKNDRIVGYTDRRGLTMRFGVATVRFGSERTTASEAIDQLAHNKRPSLRVSKLHEFGEYWRTIPTADPRFQHLDPTPAIDDPIRSAEQEFIRELNARLGPSKHVLLYVPGFNTAFGAPVRYAAELAFYLAGDVTPVAFSWPARSNPLGYSKQVTSANVSVRALRELILLLATETDAERIDVLSFSAGAPVASDALHQLRIMHSTLTREQVRERLKIGLVIYAGADEDVDRFRNLYLDGFGDIARSIVLYTSDLDFGLLLSEWFVRGSKRLGRIGHDLTESERSMLRSHHGTTQVIDVSYAQRRAGAGDIFSHSYWFGNAWVSTDVLAQIRHELRPGERGLIQVTRDDDGGLLDPVWIFPRDYDDRVIEIFAELERGAASSGTAASDGAESTVNADRLPGHP